MRQSHEHPIDESQRLLKIGIILTLFIFLLELAGGVWTHSLALISDAWHIFIDIWALVISFLAFHMARRPVSGRSTFGLHRMEVFAAALNGLTVFAAGAVILAAAVWRFYHPGMVYSGRLLGVSGIALIINLGVAALFYRRSHDDLNMRGAYVHMAADALNTLAVFISGVLIAWTHWVRIDALVSGVIAFMILWGSGRLLRDSVNTLLECAPAGIAVAEVESEIRKVDGVVSVHDLHVWSICSHLNALSGHIRLDEADMKKQRAVLTNIDKNVRDRFGIAHTTIQVESGEWPEIEGGTV